MAKAAVVIAVAAAPILAMATAASAVSLTHDSQSAVIAAEGPNHSLEFYWNIDGTALAPRAGGGAGTTWARPWSMIRSRR